MEGIAGPVVICDCEHQCRGAHECGCLEIIGPPRTCKCTCNGATFEPLVILKAEEPVNLSFRNKEVVAIAEFLHHATGADILVPVAAMRNRVTVKLEDVAFGEAVGKLGLMLRQPEDTAY